MGHPVTGFVLTLALLCSGFAPAAWAVQASPPAAAPSAAPPAAPSSSAPSAIGNDLDAFMAQVLEHRAETWRRLHDYILDEREKFELRGPGDALLFGQQRSYNWYVREGYLIRSPVKFNGVALKDEERRKYEHEWLTEEKAREQRQNQQRLDRARRKQTGSGTSSRAAAGPFDTGAPVQAGIDDLLRDGVEPRFISESYFLQFKFEPGNYYLVGRERLDNQEVLKIEYYPRKRMFEDVDEAKDEDRGGEKSTAARGKEESTKETGQAEKGEKAPKENGKKSERVQRMQDDFERKFNKVSLVTLWVDPAARQIVKYTFDLPDFGFLPGRWAVRVDDASASMAMGQVMEGVWLPRDLAVEGGFTLASGGYRFRYGRAFFDYKLGDVRAKIRGYDTREP